MALRFDNYEKFPQLSNIHQKFFSNLFSFYLYNIQLINVFSSNPALLKYILLILQS